MLMLLALLIFPIEANALNDTDVDYWPPVIAKFATLHAQQPQNSSITDSLANAYNNYGILLAKQNQWNPAITALQQAIALNPSMINQLKQNLSNIYFSYGYQLYKNPGDQLYSSEQNSTAKQLATQAIALYPGNANAYLLLGDIEYMNQQMPQAQQAWQQAASLLPGNQDVQKRLAKITTETNIENDMNDVYNPYFNIKIDKDVQLNPNLSITAILQYAHDSVAPDFNYVQRNKVPVVVYNRVEYKQALAGAPNWVEAAYDGKIRIALATNQADFNQITSDVVHEYTHVIIADITNGNCPLWLNEGIAKYEEYKHGNPPRIFMLALAYNTKNLIAWDEINQALVSSDTQTALLAYQQSFSFVYYLVQRFGMIKIVELLNVLGNKIEFNSAVQQVYGIPIETLQQNWNLWLTGFINNWAEAPVAEDTQGN
jgi:tetratricopeptide (TPR) repeat protein